MNDKFELKYKITDADMKAINKSLMWTYFIIYFIGAAVAIAIGVMAAVLRPRTDVFVMGIILAVLGGILLVCAVLLLIAPSNFVSSVLLTSDETERFIRIDADGITIATEGQDDIQTHYSEIYKVKKKGNCILAYYGPKGVLLIKDAITSGQTLEELYAFMLGKKGKAPAVSSYPENTEERKDETTDDTTSEKEA